MATPQSGPIQPLYGVVIRDKCKTADHATLLAYKKVGEDMLKGLSEEHGKDLRAALAELDHKLKS